MDDDELAFRLVRLYVKEVSKGHEKRQMGLDTIMNAYFYALLRISRKKKEMAALEAAVETEEAAPPGEAFEAEEAAPEGKEPFKASAEEEFKFE
jgi:hypothetical protein